MKNLEELRLDDTHVRDEGIKELGQCKGLRKLDLSGTEVTDESMPAIAQLANLEELHLGKTGVTDEGLKHLAPMKGLRELDLYFTQASDDGLKYLTAIKGLRRLALDATKVTDEGMKHCKSFKKLQCLGLPGSVTAAGLAELKDLTELQEIRLVGLTDDSVKHLIPFRNLERLELIAARLTDKGLVQLKELKKLRLVEHWGSSASAVTPAGVNDLQKALPECEILPHFDPPSPPAGAPSPPVADNEAASVWPRVFAIGVPSLVCVLGVGVVYRLYKRTIRLRLPVTLPRDGVDES
jgi:Leucine-rich repeat (LRR) protein